MVEEFVEYEFQNTNTTIDVFVTKQKTKNTKRRRRSGRNKRLPARQEKKNRKILLVKPLGDSKTYSKIVRDMKKSIDLNEIDVKVNSIKKTKKCYVKLNISNGKKDNKEILKAALDKSFASQVQTEIAQRRKNIVILEIDETTNDKDIKEAIIRETG